MVQKIMTRLHIEVANHIKICGVSEYFIKMCLGHDLLSLYFISSFLIMILKSKTQILEYLNMKMNVKMDFFSPIKLIKASAVSITLKHIFPMGNVWDCLRLSGL